MGREGGGVRCTCAPLHAPPHDGPLGVAEEPVLLQLLHHVLELGLDRGASADEDFRLGLHTQDKILKI